jgi:hypothetical protein
MKRQLNKSQVLARLELLRQTVEEDAIQTVYLLAVVDTLLDYNGDKDIRAAVEGIAL